MTPNAKLSGEQLEDAFMLFNQMSEKLAESYADLQTQVIRLSEELAEARSERLKQLAEKEMLASRLEGLLNTLPAGIVVLDAEGCINQHNPIASDMLVENLIGESWEPLAKRLLVNEGDELRLQDGRWVSISVRSLGTEPGKIILITDITETRALQNTVNRQQRLTSLGEMVASLAHQIRTPLASALLYLTNINHPNAEQEDRQRYTKKASERLHHLERMVNDMLVFVRGGVSASEAFNVGQFIEQFKQSLETQLKESQATLIIKNQAHDAVLCGNRDALLGAFQNLANNAIQACDTKPVLELVVNLTGDNSIQFQFKDNGCGISDEIKERILEPFFTTRSSGTGLGLAVVNATVNSYRGRFDVESKLGEGTCFSITIPQAEQHAVLPSNIALSNDSEKGYTEIIKENITKKSTVSVR